jgi:ADP-heptose:LPS heptosyltransferase
MDFPEQMYPMPHYVAKGARILIIHQGAIGDFLLALPAVRAVRQSLHPRHLAIATHPRTACLVDGRYHADSVIDINHPEFAFFFNETAQLPATLSARLATFDVALLFSNSAPLAQNLSRAGIAQVHQLAPFPAVRKHLVDYHLSSLDALGVPPVSRRPSIHLTSDDLEWGRGYLAQCIDPDHLAQPMLALHPGAGSPGQLWPPRRFAHLASVLAAAGAHPVIIQGPADEAAVRDVQRYLADVSYTLVRGLSLIQVAAVLAQLSLYVGNDSGITHLAAAVNIPTIAIFGPSDPLVWAPRGEDVYVVHHELSCAPCTISRRVLCGAQPCLAEITVDEVLEAAALQGFPTQSSPHDHAVSVPTDVSRFTRCAT